MFTASVESFIKKENIEGDLGVNLRVLGNHNRPLPVTLSAIASLRDLGDRRATPFLTSYLKLIDIRCKNAPFEFKNLFKRKIAEALKELSDKRAMPTLISLLKKETDFEVRTSAIKGLVKLKDKRVIEPILSIALNKKEAIGTRGEALEALSDIAFILVEGNAKAVTRLKVADKKLGHVSAARRGLFLNFLASDPLVLRRVPADPNAKAGKFAYLNLLKEQVRSGEHSVSELIEIFGISLKA